MSLCRNKNRFELGTQYYAHQGTRYIYHYHKALATEPRLKGQVRQD